MEKENRNEMFSASYLTQERIQNNKVALRHNDSKTNIEFTSIININD